MLQVRRCAVNRVIAPMKFLSRHTGSYLWDLPSSERLYYLWTDYPWRLLQWPLEYILRVKRVIIQVVGDEFVRMSFVTNSQGFQSLLSVFKQPTYKSARKYGIHRYRRVGGALQVCPVSFAILAATRTNDSMPSATN